MESCPGSSQSLMGVDSVCGYFLVPECNLAWIHLAAGRTGSPIYEIRVIMERRTKCKSLKSFHSQDSKSEATPHIPGGIAEISRALKGCEMAPSCPHSIHPVLLL